MKKNSILLRYFISYVLILFIPLFIMSVIIQNYYIKTCSDFVLNQKVMEARQRKESLDMQIQQLHNFAIEISGKSIFSKYNVENNPAAYNAIIKELRYFTHINTNVQEVIYHIKGSNIYYTSCGTTNDRYMFTDIMNYEEIDGQHSNIFFINLNEPVWLKEQNVYNPNINNEKIITYIIPDAINNSVMMYQLSNTFFDYLFKENKHTNRMSTFFLSKDNRLIYMHNTSEKLLNNIDKLISEQYDIMQPILLDNEEYYVYKTASNLGTFILLEVIPKRLITDQITKFNQVYYVSLIIVILLGAFVIYWVLKVNYNPIKNLSNALYLTNLKVPENLNIFESVQFAIEKLSKNTSKITEKDKDMMRESRLFQLLRGQYDSVEQFNSDCENLDIYIAGNKFRVIVLLTEFNSDLTMLESETINQLYDIMGNYQLFILEYLEEFSYILILSGDEFKDDELRKSLSIFQEYYKRVVNSNLTIGIGNEYSNIKDILRSYNEAKEAVKYKLVCGAHSIIYYKDVYDSPRTVNYSYPKSELDSLYYAIVNGNIAKIQFVVDVLIDLIRNEYQNLFFAKCLYYDVINTALRAIHDVTLSIPFLDKYKQIDFTSIGEFTEVIKMISSDIVKCLDKNKKKETSFDINAVISYINKNCSKPDFCVSSLADHFGMSVSNFSHQFKKYMNQNVSTYINNIRIQTAKTLLTSTDLSIGDIALQIGYSQPSSFIRKFKQNVGKTPGEYRLECNADISEIKE